LSKAFSQAYKLVDAPEHGCSRVEWLGTSDHSARAALIYQHATEDRDRAIAQSVSDMVAGWTGPDDVWNRPPTRHLEQIDQIDR
jgi:hypothetical protein